jgi:hypothetical protein
LIINYTEGINKLIRHQPIISKFFPMNTKLSREKASNRSDKEKSNERQKIQKGLDPREEEKQAIVADQDDVTSE